MKALNILIEDIGLDVCQHEGSDYTDGRGLVSLYLSQAFQKKGHRVEVLMKEGRSLHPEWQGKVSVRHLPFNENIPRSSKEGQAYDLVIVNHWNIQDLLPKGLPVLYIPHEIESLRHMRLGSTNPSVEKAQSDLIKDSMAVLLPSAAARDWLVSNNQIVEGKAWVHPWGVDTNIFNTSLSKAEARANLGMHPSRKTALFVGRIERRKGLDCLMRAFDKLQDSGKDLDLYVVGSAKPELDPQDAGVQTQLVDWVNTQKRQKNVFLKGGVSWKVLPSYFRACDVLVLPSLVEPFGLPAIEGLACGCSIVASDVDGLSEIVRGGKDGILTQPNDANQLANGIEQMLENAAWNSEDAVNSRVDRASGFKWELLASYIESSLDNALGQSKLASGY